MPSAAATAELPAGHGASTGHGAFCEGKTRRGGKCKKTAGWGTEHPGLGRCKLHGGCTPNHKKSAALQLGRIMGEEMDVEPHEALLWCVRIAAGEIAYCTEQISGLRRATESTMFGKKLDMWIEARQAATERLARFSKMALDAGVAERQVQLAERYGEMLAELMGGIFDELKLTKAQQKRAPEIVRRHLKLTEGGTTA